MSDNFFEKTIEQIDRELVRDSKILYGQLRALFGTSISDDELIQKAVLLNFLHKDDVEVFKDAIGVTDSGY